MVISPSKDAASLRIATVQRDESPMRRRNPRRGVLAAPLLALPLALAACGVPVGGPPRAISANQVPNGALAVNPPPCGSTPGGCKPVFLYFVSSTSGAVTPAPVRCLPIAQARRLDTVLDQLLGGPSTSDFASGFTSAIPPGTALISVSPNPPQGVPPMPTKAITVNFTSSFNVLAGLAEVQAIEQVVFTIAAWLALPGQLDAQVPVAFQIDGQPVPVPIGTGAQVSTPVTVANYETASPVTAPPATATCS